ncbi:hypothetical protein H0H87_002117 [Tephrocybe sp. NHM501043]|nr:hypothetical protein H0H87_002117 [Tephrocybe sp. NHM501043]
MDDPSCLLFQILKNISSGIHPEVPQLLTPYDYFVKTRYEELIQPTIVQRWTEDSGVTPSRQLLDDEDHYFIPASFCDKITAKTFKSLLASEQTKVKESNAKVYKDAVFGYKGKIKKLYHEDYQTIGQGSSAALVTAVSVLQPVISALQAPTGLSARAWAGGAVINGLGMVDISTDHIGQPVESSDDCSTIANFYISPSS